MQHAYNFRMARRRISGRDLGVCVRLRAARIRLGFTQEEFARQAGISRAQLEHYEYGRARLPAAVALQICHRFIVSEHWLATGSGEFRALLDLSLEFTGEAAHGHKIPNIPFIEAWDRYMAAPAAELIAGRNASVAAFIRAEPFGESCSFFKNHVGLLFDYALERLPSAEWGALHSAVQNAIVSFLRQAPEVAWKGRAQGEPAPVPGGCPGVFVDDSNLAMLKNGRSPMATQQDLWNPFLKRLRDATARRGAKSRLARSLGVSSGAVTQWLSGHASPTAENTLRLLAWVTAEEGDKPGGDHPPRGRSTR